MTSPGRPPPAPQPRPTPSPPPPQPDSSDSARRWTVAEKALSALAGVLAVASAVLALQAAQITSARDQAQESEQAASGELSALQGEVESLRAENDSLRAQNVPPSSTTRLPGPNAEPEAGAAVTVRHAGEITVAADGSGVDLDAPASDPQWGSPASYTRDGDLAYTSGRLVPAFYGELLRLGDTEANYNSCRESTGYSDGRISFDDIPVGSYICQKTGDRRISALRLTALDASSATFDVVTYDPPEQN